MTIDLAEAGVILPRTAQAPDLPQLLARGLPGLQRLRIDDRQAEAARRHGVVRRVLVLVERDLHAGDAGHRAHLVHQGRRRVAVARSVRAEQHHAVAVDAIAVGIDPVAGDMQTHHRLDPAGTIKIRPLVGEAQMRLDDAAADGLEVRHPGEAGQVLARPGAAPVLDLGHRLGVDQPVVEGAAGGGGAGGVTPPARLAVHQGDIGADMRAGQQGAPEMPGGQRGAVFLGRRDRPGCPSPCRAGS